MERGIECCANFQTTKINKKGEEAVDKSVGEDICQEEGHEMMFGYGVLNILSGHVGTGKGDLV